MAKGSRYGKIATAGVFTGTLLLLSDAAISVFRSNPAFFRDNHLWGTIGVFVAAVSSVAWLLIRRLSAKKPNRWSVVEGLSDGLDVLNGDDSNAKRAVQRVNAAIDYYNRHGMKNVKLYYGFKVPSLVAASLIPVFALMPGERLKYLTASLGVVVAVFEGLLQIGRYHDNWVTGISTRDGLERERELFLTGSGPYAHVEKNRQVALFVESASALIAQEEMEWARTRRDANDGKASASLPAQNAAQAAGPRP